MTGVKTCALPILNIENIDILKAEVVKKINALNEEEFLQYLKSEIDFHNETDIYQLSKEEEEAINERLKDIEEGRYITNEELIKQEQEWLRK